MADKKNALAELAADLKRSLDLQMPGTSYYRDRTVIGCCAAWIACVGVWLAAFALACRKEHDT